MASTAAPPQDLTLAGLTRLQAARRERTASSDQLAQLESAESYLRPITRRAVGRWNTPTARRHAAGHAHRPAGHAPRQASNSRTRGSRRASSQSSGGGDSGDSDGESDPDAELETRRCPCGLEIHKPARGPWPTRCPSCKLSAEAVRKRAERAADAPSRTCEAPGCDRPVSGRKRCCDTCWQDAANIRDAERARLADACLAGYLNFQDGDSEKDRLRMRLGLLPPRGEYGALLARANAGCRCNGARLDGGVVGCFRCGLPQKVTAS